MLTKFQLIDRAKEIRQEEFTKQQDKAMKATKQEKNKKQTTGKKVVLPLAAPVADEIEQVVGDVDHGNLDDLLTD